MQCVDSQALAGGMEFLKLEQAPRAGGSLHSTGKMGKELRISEGAFRERSHRT